MNIGVDIGFYATKAIRGKARVIFPSFIARPVYSKMSLNSHGRIEIESESGQFLLGDEAIRIGQGARQETAQWVGSPEWLSLFYGALSELTEATQFKAQIVIGLPLADYDRDKRIVRELLYGVHSFKRAGRVGQRCNVNDLRVVPQGWGAVLDQLLDTNGKIVNPEMARQRFAVIDIGGGSVNYLAVDGLSDIPAESRGTQRGTWVVVRAVRDFLDAEHPGLSRLKDHQIMQAILSTVVYDGGEKVNLTPVTFPITDAIGQEIVETAQQYWGPKASTFRNVLAIGGGAHIWRDHICQAFKHAKVLPSPEFANARGFAKFSEYLAGKESTE